MQQSDYRSRVYDHYVHSRTTSLAPLTIAGLAGRAPYLNHLIRNYFPAERSATLLDLGCGHGTLVHFARQAGYRNITGVDRSPEQVFEASRLGIDGVRLGDLVDTLAGIAACSQDAIITFDVIEHFKREELLSLVDGVARALKPGGTWIIHVPNAEAPLFGRVRYGDITHEQAFTSVSIAQLLLASGFRKVECYEDAPVIHGVRSAIRAALWGVCRSLLRVYLAVETGDTGRSAIFTQNLLAVATK